jgi:hypothetical protein
MDALKPRLNIQISTQGARAWRGIVWHHSASPDGITRDWDAIKKYHTSYRIDFEIVTKDEYQRRWANKDGKYFEEPWIDVGYHGGTELVKGDPIFNRGRALTMVGAHAGVKGKPNTYNTDFIGLCCVGNYDLFSPDPKLWDLNLMLTRALMDVFSIQSASVIGHREVYDRLNIPRQKTCPGKCWNMDLFRAEL